jgi:iron complex outermembrane receptor protein
MHRTGLFACAALVAMAFASGAQAATDTSTDTAQGAGATTLGGVIVTAQKREENLQKAAVAVTALTGSKLVLANINQPVKLQLYVPSMTFGVDNGYTYLTLRGVGNDTTTTAAESSVATYLDGVYTGDLIAESIPQYDLDRIEVLRGPQGTLYGRNTTGGVINYITKNPSFEPGATLALMGGDYSAFEGDASVTGPLADDKVAGRLSFQYGEHGGYRYNIALNQRDYSDSSISGRAALLFKPTPDLAITLRGDAAHEHNTDAFALIHSTALDGLTTPATPLGIFSLPAPVLAGLGFVLSPADIAKLNGGSIATFYHLTQPGPLPPDPLATQLVSNGEPTLFKVDSHGASATVEWHPGAIAVKSISAYRYASLFFTQDTGGIGSPSVDFNPLYQTDKQWTQEFDVSGKAFDGKLEWLAGAFYYHDDGYFATTVWLPSFGDFINASFNLSNPPGSPFLFNLNPPALINFTNFVAPNILSTVVVNGPNFVGGAPLTAFSSIPNTAFLGFTVTQTSQSIAGFFQGTYHLTDTLRFTGGFRFTGDDKRAIRSLHSNLVYALTGGNPGASLCNHTDASRSWTAPTGVAQVEYDAAPHVLTYAKVSFGYKAGGMNPGECTHIFDPEYLTDYEGGVKSLSFDGQLLANAAIYYYDYTNIQFTTYIANASAILNAGSATAFGIELEYALQPRALPGFEADGSVSFEDSHYGPGCFNDPANLAGVIPPGPDGNPPKVCPPGVAAYAQINGNELIRAPRWKTNVGVQYQAPAGPGDLLGRFEAAWTDTIYNDIFNGKATNLADVTQPGYWILNARLVWTSTDRRYTAEIFGENLLNENYATNRVAFNTPVTVDNISGQFGPPRTFGGRIIVRLGSGQ